ncbi:MAG TPA: DNA alkylation repair protein [Lachnospiraceae bacterium]
MAHTKIQEDLFALQDLSYRDFNAKLIPNIDKETMIGIRVPHLRSFAKGLKKENELGDFMEKLPHKYFEENLLHGILLSEEKDYRTLIKGLDEFLPYVDNWAACDLISPKIFKKHRKDLKENAFRWMNSKEPYTIRFGIKVMMEHYLDEDFEEEFLREIGKISSEEYYVNMMIAWYLATALAKQYKVTISLLEDGFLSDWVQNKTIQKAIESYRVGDEEKKYLKTLKRKKKRG